MLLKVVRTHSFSAVKFKDCYRDGIVLCTLRGTMHHNDTIAYFTVIQLEIQFTNLFRFMNERKCWIVVNEILYDIKTIGNSRLNEEINEWYCK